MTQENQNRPQLPSTKEFHPGNIPVEEGGERPVEDFRSQSTNRTIPLDKAIERGYLEKLPTGEITLDPEAGRFIPLPSTENTPTEATPETKNRNGLYIGGSIGLAAIIAAGGAVIANQQPGTPPETQPSATGAPIPGETQAPVPTNPVESPFASPTNLGPLETPKPSASEVGPGVLNEFGITAAEYGQVKESLTIDADTYKTPEEVTSAFMNVIDTYYAGGHSMETRNAHYDDTTPSGQVGWNAWSNELYTKALKESVLTPSSIERSDSPISNLKDNKSIANRLWVNAAKAGEKKYEITTSFEIEDVSEVSEKGFTVIGTKTQSDNSEEIPSAASDSGRIVGEMRSENAKIVFIKIENQWRVASFVSIG